MLGETGLSFSLIPALTRSLTKHRIKQFILTGYFSQGGYKPER